MEQKTGNKKKVICMFLIMSLLIGILGGCDKIVQKNKEDNGQGTNKEQTKQVRYMEKNVPLPKGVKSDEMFSLVEGKDKKIELFALNKKNEIYEHYVKTENGWKKHLLNG